MSILISFLNLLLYIAIIIFRRVLHRVADPRLHGLAHRRQRLQVGTDHRRPVVPDRRRDVARWVAGRWRWPSALLGTSGLPISNRNLTRRRQPIRTHHRSARAVEL